MCVDIAKSKILYDANLWPVGTKIGHSAFFTKELDNRFDSSVDCQLRIASYDMDEELDTEKAHIPI